MQLCPVQTRNAHSLAHLLSVGICVPWMMQRAKAAEMTRTPPSVSVLYSVPLAFADTSNTLQPMDVLDYADERYDGSYRHKHKMHMLGEDGWSDDDDWVVGAQGPAVCEHGRSQAGYSAAVCVRHHRAPASAAYVPPSCFRS